MNQLSYNWWTVGLRGVLARMISLLAFFFSSIMMVSIHLQKEIQGEWMLNLSEIATQLFGLDLMAIPAVGLLML